MEFLLVPVPLFDKYFTVAAYIFRYQLADYTQMSPTQDISPPLEALTVTGVDAFTGGKPIFVPIATAMLDGLAKDCSLQPELTVFLLEDVTGLTEANISCMQVLKDMGFRFAANQEEGTLDDEALMNLLDYILLLDKPMAHADRRAMVIRYTRFYKHIKVVATGLTSTDAFTHAASDGFHLFEGMFYRVPSQRKDRELTPIKSNLLRLLNLVRDENFEFKDIVDIMRRDTALSYMLMRFINSPYLGVKYKVKSIQHAVIILGQIEVRKWVTAAVFKALGSDRPSELTRISLVRAKFAENLAALFDLREDSPSIFLMGLFSVLDTMLDTNMESALEQVMVSDEISQALVHHKGKYYPILELVVNYERADWNALMGVCAALGLHTPDIYAAYLEAISWYNDLINDKVRYAPNNSRYGAARPSLW